MARWSAGCPRCAASRSANATGCSCSRRQTNSTDRHRRHRRFEPREAERRPGPSVSLAVDETFTLVAENGAPLLEIVRSADGPVVRLLHADTQLELPGKLRIQATEIELMARRGSVHIEADDDVVLHGEMVRLN